MTLDTVGELRRGGSAAGTILIRYPAGMNGLETYQKKIDRLPGQEALIASALFEKTDVKRAKELGASPFVRNPCFIGEMGSALNGFGRNKRLEDAEIL